MNSPARDFPEMAAFLDEIGAVCRKHGFSISHEDGHGAFEIDPFSESRLQWLNAAQTATEETEL